MQYQTLGSSPLKISKLCLGTMTFGEQNSEADAHAQMDYALERGINFLDTAEMYPVPGSASTQGRTETYIGTWLSRGRHREAVVLASKVCGRAGWIPHVRDGNARLDADNISAAVDASLKRLQTDYIDLYQTHWPDRASNFFGQLGYQPKSDGNAAPLEETVAAMARLVDAGKIRYYGMCNETPWGLMRAIEIADRAGLPRPVSIQNPYNLLNRTFEIGLAEVSHREDVGLLPYSPLGFGVLSGKYLGGARPAGSRVTLFKHYKRYINPNAEAATEAYVRLARQHGLEPAALALAFVQAQPFVASTIIGATTLEQLRSNIDSADVRLDKALLKGIEAIHEQYPNPAP